MKHGSLFAGIGGFDLGFERNGIETVWTVEKDKNCNQVLATHWPNVRRHTDVKEVGRHNLSPVDIISGGFPCQDVSVAGRREGLAGDRSGLWFEFARIVEEMAPQWVVVENVPGLLSSQAGRDFLVVLRALEELGYCGVWRVLDSQYFGVPQRRRRVFIVGSLGNASSVEVLFDADGKLLETVEGGLVSNTLIGRGTVDASGGAGIRNLVVATLRTSGGPDSQYRNEYIGDRRNGGLRLRKQTPIEWERLQGFPDGWTEGLSDSARYRCLGNAVTVNVAEWIGRRLVNANLR